MKYDKLSSIRMSLKDVLDTIGCIYPSSSIIGDIKSILIQNSRLNSYYHRQEDNPIVIGFAIIISLLFIAVDEANLHIELCPRLSQIGSHPGPGMQDYQLDLMIRYVDESDLSKFTKILNELYAYTYVENGG